MKKIFIPLLLAIVLPATFSCSAGRLAGYTLNEQDAAAAIRQMLQIGTQDGKLTGAFSKETIMTTLFPGSVGKVLNTLQTLGLTNEVDRFANTFGTAAESAANNAVPVFVNGITSIKFNDAMRIIKAGGTSGTDYLKSTIGSDLRRSITPAMQSAINEYKLNEQWDKLIQPVKGITGNKLNLDLANLMAGIVAEKMFQKISEKELEIRSNANARSTTLLQKVFSRSWN
ncbi:MAG: hypothetical protein JWP88_1054 [Flaviaesturariibacter sp.]|nr:hypothetical protein [Flaviaesturariibacter sp.]